MKLNKTLAVALHRAMWTDMKTELGDNPTSRMREDFKIEWKKRYFPNECVMHNCFLCEYSTSDERRCHKCPIRWPEGTCCGRNFSYDTAPISEILALPEKDLKPTGFADITYDSYYKFREEQISKASGLPASSSIEDHIKAIQEKAVEDDSAKKASFYIAIAKASDAFKKYAEEKMEPLKQTNDSLTKRHIAVKKYLAQQSGLDHDRPVEDHIEAIKQKAKAEGYDTAKEYIAKCSGVSQNELLFDHIRAIKEKAVEEYFEKTPGAKLASMDVDRAFKQYADEQKAPIFHALAEASGLSAGNKSVKAHISKIKDHERERIMDKIGEMLNDKSTGKNADS